MKNIHWNIPPHIAFGKTLADKTVRNWIGIIPRAFDNRFFELYEEKIAQMVSQLEATYN